MKAVEFDEQNVIIAENQPEYENLPALIQKNSITTFCMQLDSMEVYKVMKNATAEITVLNFGNPVQPISVSVKKPNFPQPPNLLVKHKTIKWDDVKGTATFAWEFNMQDLKDLKETKTLWISVITYGRPLQPINPTL